jgi:Spy/CpxP family protein refolding chaperone
MKRNIFHLAFIISVIFNLAAAGAVVYGLTATKSAASKNKDMFAAYDRLKLTEDQKKVFGVHYMDIIRRITEAQKQYKAKWAEVVELVSQPNPDWSVIEAKQKEILDASRETQSMIFHRWDDVKTYMTPEQQKVFYEILRERINSGEMSGDVKNAKEMLDRQSAKP